MDQLRRQSSEIQGHGNVVVQIMGDGNVANFTPQLPALWLTTYDSPLYAEVQSVLPEAGRPGGYTATGKEEAGLLSPFTRSLTMLGRDQMLSELAAWLDGPRPVSVQVMVGGGGRGKTRLALELCAAARDRSWLAGFVVRDELARFRAQQTVATWGWSRPVLIVVDYAAAKAEALAGWLAELTHHHCWTDPTHPKLRLLLLERHGSSEDAWWRRAFGEGGPAADATRRMLAAGTPVRLGLLGQDQREAVFAEAYRLATGTAPPRIAELDRLLEMQSLGGEPLFLAMSGLSAARIGIDPALAQAPDELAIGLARQELSRVRAIWSDRGLPISGEKRLDHHLAAVVTLCEGLSEQDAHAMIMRECEALHLPVAQGTEPTRAALHAALPADAGGIAPILPDILGEAAMIAAWGDTQQGTDAVRRAVTDRRESVTRVVIRACQDFLVRGQRVPLRWLQVLRASSIDIDGLSRLAAAMPSNTTELREMALEVTQAALDAITAHLEGGGSEEATLAPRAGLLNNLSGRLSALGRREAALTAIEEAITAYRALAAARPDAFAPDLARSLNNLSLRLSDLGRREAALTASEEAVAAYRALAAARPDAFAPDLARSLNNLSNRLSALGRREAALAASEEAVAAYRALAAAQPDAFAPDLAGSLNNLSVRLSDLGRREAALTAIEEAVAAYRTLAAARPDAFAPDLARSLNNLSNRLSDLGRREAALVAVEEAVAIRRALAVTRPDAFAPDLASSLHNLSNHLSDLGSREAALVAVEEAVAIRRALAVTRPDAFAPDLAGSLNNLSNHLSDLGSHEAALAASEEAVAAYRALAATRPDAFAPDLASSLNNLSNHLSVLGSHEAALAASEEAVAAYRALAATRPDAFAPDLATSINNLSNCLSALGRREAALAAVEEAVAIRRVLAAARPDAFAPDLAGSLGALGQIALSQDPGAAVEAFAEGMRVLSPIFRAIPQAHAPLMHALRGDYLSACKAAAREPDANLLAPIAAVVGDPEPMNDQPD